MTLALPTLAIFAVGYAAGWFSHVRRERKDEHPMARYRRRSGR